MRFILADDHALFRQGLKSLLSLEPDFDVVAEVQQAGKLPDAMTQNSCDILLLDLQMDRWLMDDIPQLSKECAVIVITASGSAENTARAMRLGRAVVQRAICI